MLKKCVAEFVGTMILVVFGCGVAVATGCTGNDGIVGPLLGAALAALCCRFLESRKEAKKEAALSEEVQEPENTDNA